MVRLAWISVAGLPYVFLLLQPGYTAPAQKAPPFKDVAAIFKAHCYSCHTGKQSAAGLDLTTIAGINKGGISGKMIVPGKPDASLLLKRVKGMGGMPQMPMGFAPLTPAQMDTLKGWILAGGKTDATEGTHWAYIPPKRFTVPTTKNKTWARNPIDSFILARLEKGGLKPSPQASRETLIRRVTLDLTGLPPTLQEIDAFLADKSPKAYDKVVERLLASPHYGEHQARGWLDLARYADSNGYEADHRRVAWKYRDWVINAFNRNLPYDRFTIEQLAGDLLPQPNLDQLIATGFHRNTMLNLEGGIDPAETRYEMINDRVATTSTVWLGQTMQCARCHDHKYDPISQKDYFRMYAVFANTEYTASGDKGFGAYKFFEKDIPVPSPEQRAEDDRLRAVIQDLRKKVTVLSPEDKHEMDGWLSKAKSGNRWSGFKAETSATNGVTLNPQSDGTLLAQGPSVNSVYRLKFTASGPIQALKLQMIPDGSLPQKGVGRGSSGNFLLSRISLKVNGSPVGLTRPAADYIQEGYNLQGLLDSNTETGWAVWPEVARKHWLVVRPEKPIPDSAIVELELGNESTKYPDHSLGRFIVTTSQEPDEMIQVLPDNIAATLSKPALTEAEQKSLNDFYQRNSPKFKPIWEKIDSAQNEINVLNRSIPNAMIMTEKKGAATLRAPIHIRGEFLQTGEMVTSGIPTAFGKTDAKRVDRLELAKWLVSKDNPLTARVQINRMWEQYFGTGFVETSENFGTPGTPPMHPELYDWLSTEFMARSWDLKAMHRMIVTSSTYRQSSVTTKALIERDPQNRLLARGPRFRMDAEMIRDNSLAASGMLNLKVGGPSVFPHQPPKIWDSPYNGDQWPMPKGQELHRRGLYTFWKRTAPYPTFVNFDATSREFCTVRRGRTNTPLQALNLLNDEAFLEAAKNLARLSLSKLGNLYLTGARLAPTGPSSEGGRNTPRAAIEIAFRRATGRFAKAGETERLMKLHSDLTAKYRARPEDAKKLGETAEDAAMVMVASVILNLDETINKE